MKLAGLFSILILGLIVEGANYQAMFYEFMNDYREDWEGFGNQIAAVALSAFMLLNIVIWGFRNEQFTIGLKDGLEVKYHSLSNLLAFVTMLISFAVYWEILDFDKFSVTIVVTVILSAGLPYLVAYTSHQIGKEFARIAKRKHRTHLRNLEAAEEDIAWGELNLRISELESKLQKQVTENERLTAELMQACHDYDYAKSKNFEYAFEVRDFEKKRSETANRILEMRKRYQSQILTPKALKRATTKKCLNCNTEISGTARKRYCSDLCRATYNRNSKTA
ncbi:MAG: hypothetical protein AAF740_01360 [Bacteroidota bacterium]